MPEKREFLSKRVIVKITPTDFTELKREFSCTVFRSFSDFLRFRLRQQPVIKKVRNQSVDDLLEILAGIKTDVEFIRMGFGRTVEKLQTTLAIPNEALDFILAEELEWKAEIAAIKQTLIKLYEEWSRG